MRILIVEDDPLLGDALRTGLKQRGFDADWVKDGVAAELALTRGSKLPVLLLTARDAVDDRVRGFDTGADDYVVKPVDLDELAARLRAHVRRSRGEPAPILEIGDLRVDPAARTVVFRGKGIELKAREFNLLQEFMLNAGRVLSREQLEGRLYAWGDEVESNTVEVHIHHLRRKLAPEVIRTVRGVGYVLPRERNDG
jgi:DNA-binding response OmpR family regulator